LPALPFRHIDDLTQPPAGNNCHTGPIIENQPAWLFFKNNLHGKALRDGI
jgi:hypothetical protein